MYGSTPPSYNSKKGDSDGKSPAGKIMMDDPKNKLIVDTLVNSHKNGGR